MISWEVIIRYKGWLIAGAALIALVLIKVIWVAWANGGLGRWDKERKDIIGRSNFLTDKVITSPMTLLDEMPGVFDLQFKGEWALYSCSMYAKALCNISDLYPETRQGNIARVDSLISLAQTPEIRMYDRHRWGEDPLETLSGDNSHISYISHLAWMIGNYAILSGDSKYNALHSRLCEAMNRRILANPSLNLPTYPGESIYIPDMLVAIVALNDFAKLNDGKYADTVAQWLQRAKSDWIDADTGLLVSFLDQNGRQIDRTPVKGSYSALNCYYLALINADFAESQYNTFKERFIWGELFAGVREYIDRSPLVEPDCDAGVILFGLSPSGTAFAIGPATYFKDDTTRQQLMRTAEIAGHTVGGDERHYLLSKLALVGEAVVLAMRTTLPPN